MRNGQTQSADSVWSIDADAPLQSVLDSPGMSFIPECPPLLRQTLTGALSWQVRNKTSVARALKSSRLAPQWLAALLALGATVTVKGRNSLEETLLEALLQRRGEDEVTALHVPLGGTDRRWGEAHVARTPADEPIVAAIAAVTMDERLVREARVALTGAWSEGVRLAEAPSLLVDGPLDESRVRKVAQAVEREVAPEGDYLGSEEYRRAMAGVLTRRALEACLQREANNE